MRTFIAIKIPEEIRKSLARLQNKLKACGADVKWVEPANIHLTLKFIGEIEEGKIPEIERAMREAAGNKASFKVRIGNIGAFPDLRHPRVIWAGINQGEKETRSIANELEERLEALGVPKENREFAGHLTLGRARSLKNMTELIKKLEKLKDLSREENFEFKAGEITLFKSTLTPQGAFYEALKEASFIAA
jgi:2'-5' RNA ligase